MKIKSNCPLTKYGPRVGRIRLTSAVSLILFAGLALLLVACVSEADERNKAGVSLAKRGESEKAIVEFDGAIRADPELALAYYNRAQVYFGIGQFDAAKKDYDQAVSLEPESILFYTQRGNAYLALGEYELAIKDQNKAVSLDPKFALGFYNRGGAYVVVDRSEEAIEDYNQAVALDRRINQKNNVSVRCELFDDLYKDDVAFKDCRGLFSHDPLFAKAFADRGFEKLERGENLQAIYDYDKAIHLSAAQELYNNRGLAYKGLGNFDEAFQDFKAANGPGAGFAPAYYNQGSLLYELGEYQFAVSDYSRAIQVDPSYVDAYADRALAYTLLKKDKAAELDIDRAVELGVDRIELAAAIQELKSQR